MSETIGRTLRERVLTSPKGVVRIDAGGWSIVLSGGPNDPFSRLAERSVGPTGRPADLLSSGPGGWRLSGKRIDRRTPSEANLAFLGRVARGAGAPDTTPAEPIVGTWHWAWAVDEDAGDEEPPASGTRPDEDAGDEEPPASGLQPDEDEDEDEEEA